MRVKNWHKFQHFKDRSPPWIKFYRDLLDDLEWHELPPASAKALVMIWLIASENKGELPDMKTLAFRLRMSETQTKTIVSGLSHWLEQDDIAPISDGHQDDGLETERETEKEKEGEADVPRKRAESFTPPDWVPAKEWAEFIESRKKHPPTFRASELLVIELAKLRDAGHDPAKVLEQSTRNGWRDLFALRSSNGSTTNRRNSSLAEQAAEAERLADAHLGPL